MHGSRYPPGSTETPTKDIDRVLIEKINVERISGSPFLTMEDINQLDFTVTLLMNKENIIALNASLVPMRELIERLRFHDPLGYDAGARRRVKTKLNDKVNELKMHIDQQQNNLDLLSQRMETRSAEWMDALDYLYLNVENSLTHLMEMYDTVARVLSVFIVYETKLVTRARSTGVASQRRLI
jgi:hypothetical protein